MDQQVAHGVPLKTAQRMSSLVARGSTGDLETLADGVQQALGREPRCFEDFVVAAAATGCWS